MLDAPSTRRPPAPIVAGVAPLITFRRQQGVTRREGGWLRVWFARPWFRSGWDEFPALIASRDAQPASPAADAWHVSTLVAPDPARGAGRFHGIRPEDLGGPPDSWEPVPLHEMSVSDAAGGPVVVLSDRIIDWDPDKQAWFTDVRVHVPNLYFPFVRLVVAVDQPASLTAVTSAPLRVSPVVQLDPVQTLPDRELTHSVTATGVRLTLTGPSYSVTLAPVNQGTAEQPNWSMEPLADAAPSRARLVVQRRSRSDGDELLAWDDLFEQHFTQDPEAPPATIAATCFLPFDPAQPPGEFRAVVLEEDFTQRRGSPGEPGTTVGRVTFAEHIPLPRAVSAG